MHFNLKLKINKHKIRFLITLLISIYLFDIKINALPNKSYILSIVDLCFSSKMKKDCIKALIELEGLQIKKAELGEYSCNTRILALQSDLIMILHDLEKRRVSKKMIREVKKFCF